MAKTVGYKMSMVNQFFRAFKARTMFRVGHDIGSKSVTILNDSGQSQIYYATSKLMIYQYLMEDTHTYMYIIPSQ